MKITIEQQEKGKELYDELVQKAWDSTTFKEQLINNPEGTIEEVTGISPKLPKDTKVVVEDQTDASIIYLNIPQKVDLEDFELTEEELEAVSGGEHSGSWNPIYNLGYYAHKALHYWVCQSSH